MLGKAPTKMSQQASKLGVLPNITGKCEAFHDIKIEDGRFSNFLF